MWMYQISIASYIHYYSQKNNIYYSIVFHFSFNSYIVANGNGRIAEWTLQQFLFQIAIINLYKICLL